MAGFKLWLGWFQSMVHLHCHQELWARSTTGYQPAQFRTERLSDLEKCQEFQFSPLGDIRDSRNQGTILQNEKKQIIKKQSLEYWSSAYLLKLGMI